MQSHGETNLASIAGISSIWHCGDSEHEQGSTFTSDLFFHFFFLSSFFFSSLPQNKDPFYPVLERNFLRTLKILFQKRPWQFLFIALLGITYLFSFVLFFISFYSYLKGTNNLRTYAEMDALKIIVCQKYFEKSQTSARCCLMYDVFLVSHALDTRLWAIVIKIFMYLNRYEM